MDLQSAVLYAKTLWETDPNKSKNEIEVINKYGKIFHPEKIDNLSAEEFKSFLNFKNNKHWTGLERAGYRLTEDMVWILKKGLMSQKEINYDWIKQLS